ncbi:MAG: hypothetical protein GY700_01630 [Propionibacteriaceae bacterium]|nr:hypothetical protein [Propionibacteriaceae bacterium]
MRELSIWLDAHCPRGDMGVFRTVAELRDASTTDTVEHVSNGREIVDCILDQSGFFDHIVIAGHGGTTWLLDDRYGVTTGVPKNETQVEIDALANAISFVAEDGVLISLAACLCSRSPSWFLRWKLGQRNIGSDWGPRAYLPGGQASFSSRLRDAMWWHGVAARVRGHRASGHASALSLLAEHSVTERFYIGTPCTTLFKICFPDIEPTLLVRRKWTRLVTGRLAERWLMGDDSVPGEIRDRWAF